MYLLCWPCLTIQVELALPSAEVPLLRPPAAASADQQQSATCVLSSIAASTTGPAQGVDPVALADLGARAFSILANFGCQLLGSQPWTQHLQERAAMVRHATKFRSH